MPALYGANETGWNDRAGREPADVVRVAGHLLEGAVASATRVLEGVGRARDLFDLADDPGLTPALEPPGPRRQAAEGADKRVALRIVAGVGDDCRPCWTIRFHEEEWA